MPKTPLINKVMPAGSPDWNVRRAMAFLVMLFCFTMIPLGAFVVASDTRADTLMTNSFTVLGSLVIGYICAAVVDDHFRRRTRFDEMRSLEPGQRVEEATVTRTVVKEPTVQVPATPAAADPAPDDLPTEPPRQVGAG